MFKQMREVKKQKIKKISLKKTSKKRIKSSSEKDGQLKVVKKNDRQTEPRKEALKVKKAKTIKIRRKKAKKDDYDRDTLKTIKNWTFAEKGKNEFFIRQTFEEYVSFLPSDKKILGKAYSLNLHFSRLFSLMRHFLRKIFKTGVKLSYRTAAVSITIFLLGGAFPLVLSAPQSKTVATKVQWEAGNFTDIISDGATDAIELKADGAWTARTWAVPPDSFGAGHTSVAIGNYIYAFRGYSDKSLFRYDIKENEWDILENLPIPAFYGSGMIYDGAGKIYMIFGGYSKKFYSYDIDSGNFAQLPEMLDTPWTGAGMETDGTDIFIVRGNNSTDFWRYDVSEAAWYNLAPTPAAVSTGGSLVNGQNGYLYLVRGANSNNFYRYSLADQSWDTSIAGTSTTDCGGSCTMNGEEKGVYHDGYLYFLRSGNTPYFLRYKIANPLGDTWEVLSSDNAPLNVNYASMNVYSEDGNIYVFRGNGSFDFWKFDPAAPSGSRWVGPKQVQDASGNLQTIGTGGDIIWNGADYLYAIRGNNNAAVFRYTLSSGNWEAMNSLPFNANNDEKGVFYNGNLYLPQYNSTSIHQFDGTNWSVMSATLPQVAYEGASIAYNSSGLFMTRGGGSRTFYRYNGSSWVQDADIIVDGVTYNVNTGGRLISDGTDFYLTPGDGETSFLKYHSGAWSKLSDTPFAPYYGTDLTYNGNGKIMALAGYYRDETWEYTISTDTWRKLSDNQKYTYGRGPYNGASIEWVGGNSFYATTGMGLADMWSYTSSASNYKLTGIYVSEIMDLSQVSDWVSFSHNEDVPANTSVTYETRTSSDEENWSEWEMINGEDIESSVERYIQVRIILESTDGVSTPVVNDFTISYNNEDSAPVNPESLNAYSQQVGGAVLESGQDYAHDHPYFSWPAASDTEAGVEGYYVYFGTNSAADPKEDGAYQSATTYLVNEAMETGTYYLKIKSEDKNGNTSDAWDAFTYVYSGVSPYLSSVKTDQPDFEIGELDGVSASSLNGTLRLSSTDGFWNEARLSVAPGGIYNGGELAQGACKEAGENSVNDNHCLYTFRGNGLTDFLRYEVETDTWTTSASSSDLASAPLGVNRGSNLVEGPVGYLYATRGDNYPTLWMYDISNMTWTTLGSAPKNFYYGSSLSYDGSRYIYAMPGNDDAFYRYDTCNEVSPCTPSWSQKANANFDNPNTSDGQRTYEGSDSIYDGRNNVYVVQGNYYPYMAKYSISNDETEAETSNTWTPLSRVPVGFYNGGAMAFDDQTNSIFALSGKGRLSFFKYDIEGDAWLNLPDAPGTISYGASLTVLDGYIYVTRGGNNNSFYRFNIADNTWELPQFGLFGPHYLGYNYFNFSAGASMASDEDSSIYIIRGNRDNAFGKYNTETGTFIDLKNMPVGAYNGASLAYDGNENSVYYVPGDMRARRSGASNYFYKYDIDANTWTELTSRPPGQIYAGSSMIFDGERYLYLTQGGNNSTWWRYDTCNGQSVCTPGWSGNLPVISGFDQRNGAQMVYKDGMIYALRGNGYSTFFKCDTSLLPGSCWNQLPDNLPANIGTGGSLTDGRDGYLYAVRGGNTSDYYRWPISGGSWETIFSVPAQVNTGGESLNFQNRNWVVSGSGSNTWADGIYSYIIGSEANGTGFEKTGEYISEPIDLTSVYHWANLSVTYSQPENTFLSFETQTSDNGEDWSSWSPVTNEHSYKNGRHTFSINSDPAEFIKIKINFSSSNRIYSPSVSDFILNYYQDISAPNNPTEIHSFDTLNKITPITTDTYYNNVAPYFEWPEADTAGGAVDNQGGSGIAGYYVCFGTTTDCNDPYLDGEFQTENNFTASELISGQSYYLKIKAVDNAGMFPGENFEAFTYHYDSAPPINPSDISVNPTGYSSSSEFTFIWSNDAADADSGLAKFQYRTGEDAADVWHDASDPFALSQIASPYQANKNTFYLRAMDNAGNASLAMAMDYFWSGGAASPPADLQVDPSSEDNKSNQFTFTWDLPESYAGTAEGLTYYYSVNYLPTPFNTVETKARAAGPGPFATQFGKNTFYVVAMSQGGVRTNPNDVDWDHPASVDFYARTTAPGPPINYQIFDTSDRESQEYSVALKWSVPGSYDSGNFSGYTIYRSLDGENFSEVATTTGLAYVDTELESKLYYYYVRSRDKTNNLSTPTSILSITPTGRYTSPPLIVDEPVVTVESFAAKIAWSTNRVSSSFVEYGTSSGLGKTNGQVDSVISHAVELTGLDAATKYFYRVKYIDPDGNIGTSKTGIFTTNDPPTISDVVAGDIGLDSVHISWSTNMSGTCTLKYGEGSLSSSIEESSGGTTHMQKVISLKSATQYVYQVECLDADENSFDSDQYTFTTLEQPRVSDFTVQNKENVDIPTIEIAYNTTHPTTTLVKFKGSNEGNYHNYLISEYTTEHKATIEGLDPAIEYEVIASGIDENGVETAVMSSKVTTLTDSRPPGITTNRATGRVIGLGKDSRANLYVKIETDETTTVKVLFGKGTILGNFEQSTQENPANTYHLITIPVDPGQVYSYVVEAVDTADNKTISKPATVVVEGVKENATEIVVNTFSDKFGWIPKLWEKK